ncbi:MAG: hypothetical protein GEU75_06340 [Dehalococcoidia bacterium]|nr:hypothetical protein [Dehalococcoidia bacterium]
MASVALLVIGVVVVAGSQMPARSVTAQQASAFEIVIPGQSLSRVATGPETLGQWMAELRAYANGVECTRANVATSSDVVLQLGLAGQPAACSTDGARVVLVDVHEFQLAQEFTLAKGTRVTLTNLAPLPPDMQGPAQRARTEAAASQQGLFEILVPGTSLASPLSVAATGYNTMGESLGSLTVYANFSACTTVDVATTSDVLLQIGLPGQPAECGTNGAPVYLVDGRGRQLTVQYTLTKGIRVTLTNFAPTPPGVQNTTESARSRAPQGTGIIPPAAGDAGLAASRP